MKFSIIALALMPAFVSANTRSDTIERMNDAATVLHEIMSAPDKGIPQDILGKAQCVGIIPGVKKAGFIVGAKYGKGILVCRDDRGWSAPSTVVVEGGSVSLQIGAGETDAEMHAEILSYSRSRGLFAGVDLGGATLRPDNGDNRAVYGHDVSQREILTGEVPPPAAAHPLYEELNRFAPRAKNSSAN